LALLLCDLELPHDDLIVPVPVHLNRLRQREFNQTALIARHLSKIIHIPLELYALRKVRDTAPQVQMNREKRLKNLKKAFQADDIVSGKHILLIDDVITTGATAKACATSLIKAGAVEVTIAAVAYSLPKY
jgi:ComF family protein